MGQSWADLGPIWTPKWAPRRVRKGVKLSEVELSLSVEKEVISVSGVDWSKAGGGGRGDRNHPRPPKTDPRDPKNPPRPPKSCPHPNQENFFENARFACLNR